MDAKKEIEFRVAEDFGSRKPSEAFGILVARPNGDSGASWVAVDQIKWLEDGYAMLRPIDDEEEPILISEADETLVRAMMPVTGSAHSLRVHAKRMSDAFISSPSTKVRLSSADRRFEMKVMLEPEGGGGSLVDVYDMLSLSVEELSKMSSARFVVDSATGESLRVTGLYEGYGKESMPILYLKDGSELLLEDDGEGGIELLRAAWEPIIHVVRESCNLVGKSRLFGDILAKSE